jgi:hypothetical protein
VEINLNDYDKVGGDMKHNRKDYNRIQDLARIYELLADMAFGMEGDNDPQAAEVIRYVMDNLDRKYGPLNVEPIPEDEPVFVLRGKDAVAMEAVRYWAIRAQFQGAQPNIVEKAID